MSGEGAAGLVKTNSTEPPQPSCEVINGDDIFGIFVQMVLAGLGLLALFVKRYNEYPRRTTLVWALDVTKQIVSGCVLHAFGMLSAIVMHYFSEGLDSGDHCSWYFIGFTFSTTFGTLFSYLLVVWTGRIALKLGWTSLEHSGEYGDPAQVRMPAYFLGYPREIRCLTCAAFAGAHLPQAAVCLVCHLHRLTSGGALLLDRLGRSAVLCFPRCRDAVR